MPNKPMNNDVGYDICANCGAVRKYGTMKDIDPNEFDIFCNKCLKIIEKEKNVKQTRQNRLR